MSFWSLAAEKLGADVSGWKELECRQDATYGAVKIQCLGSAVLASRALGDGESLGEEDHLSEVEGNLSTLLWVCLSLTGLFNNEVVTLLNIFKQP